MTAAPIKESESCSSRLTRAGVLALALAALISLATLSTSAQQFNVIYSFTGQGDGASPFYGVTSDAAGALYGTTFNTAYKLSKRGGAWTFTRLYTFRGGDDGLYPSGRFAFGRDGAFYSITSGGGALGCSQYGGCGTVYKLTPAARPMPSLFADWNELVLYRFHGDDGDGPWYEVAFDQAGNLYGSTATAGSNICGLVYMLNPAPGTWKQTILHSFHDSDGCQPFSGVILDAAGNAYGVTNAGGPGSLGTVFELTPSAAGWTLQTLYGFGPNWNDGLAPMGALIFDALGNLYGTTPWGGSGDGGTVFMLSPSGGSWNFSVLYALPSTGGDYGPVDRLAMDAAGNLYGSTYQNGAFGNGSIFELVKGDTGWSYRSLHDFTGDIDGANPSAVTLAPNGHLYGTTMTGGRYGGGDVWEIVP